MILAVIRLIGFLLRFGEESLQMDFAAFYTAGESLNHGLSPYKNYIDYNPSIWDGVATFRHSRFLYPPLTALLFQPLAMLPYATAKYIWMVLSLASVVYSTWLINLLINPQSKQESLLILLFFTATFHPLLTLLERGQIDGLILLLLILGLKLIATYNSTGKQFAGGILWALATLLKLHCLYLFPFLLTRRKWIVLGGYVFGLLILLLLSLLTVPHLTADYVQQELPRIARFGEGGDETMKLPTEIIQVQLSGLPKGYTQKGGFMYRYESFQAISNASLVRIAISLLRRVGVVEIHPTILSLIVFLILFCGIWVWQAHRSLRPNLSAWQEVAYWQSVFTVILLSAPLTWVMSTVWLLPLVTIILHFYAADLRTSKDAYVLVLCALGFLVAWMPDHFSFPLLIPYIPTKLANAKYIVSEFLVLVSLVWLLDINLRRSNGSVDGV
ncbi:MAG: glycosyltransferase family 87 protein [Anaerolineae bacterium]